MFPTRSTLVALLSLALPLSVSSVLAQSSVSNPGGVTPSAALSADTLPAESAGSSAAVTASRRAAPLQIRPFSRLEFGVKVGLLGIGFEAATPIARDLNLRGGGNFFDYSRSFSVDDINYDAKLNLRSAEASLDFFPWTKAFHISPGALLYKGMALGHGNANVPSEPHSR